MKRNRTLLGALLVLLALQLNAQSLVCSKAEPAFWWAGMKSTRLQVLLAGSFPTGTTASTTYSGVQSIDVQRADSSNYLLLYINMAPQLKPGTAVITLTSGKKKVELNYEFKARRPAWGYGLNQSDLVYLIMPDRFANGDPANDNAAGYFEKADRKDPNGRHGGDIKGVEDHLGYLKELGVTAIWLNPVLENNMQRTSYHGYAITDLYKVDARFGGDAAYLKFIESSHKQGMKVVKDMVMNHIGSEHVWMKAPPFKTWINNYGKPYKNSNFHASVISDPHAASIDQETMTDGWFDRHMPDLNQRDPHLAQYLIQNTLWWIEYAGLDGIRLDTYPYPDKDFSINWSAAIENQYPGFFVVGEVWVGNTALAGYWLKNSKGNDGYKSSLPSATDFPLKEVIATSFREEGGWDNGMARLYNVLSQDFRYEHPERLLTFADNHDVSRVLHDLRGDQQKLEMALAFLLTTRGIPQLYYGTELLMDGDGGFHPNIRKDLVGGWAGDSTNNFLASGRTAEQNKIFGLISTISKWKQSCPAMKTGGLTHFIPDNNVYIYGRVEGKSRVVVILNANKKAQTVSTARYAQVLGGATAWRNVMSKQPVTIGASMELEPNSFLILEQGN